MTEVRRPIDYYGAYKGPDVYRYNLKNMQKPFSKELPNGSLNVSLIQPGTSVAVASDATGWLYVFGESGVVIPGESTTYSAKNEDLFYLRSGAQLQLEGQLEGLFLTRSFTDQTETHSSSQLPLVTQIPSRTDKIVDWAGSWQEGMEGALMHAGREGTTTLDPDTNAIVTGMKTKSWKYRLPFAERRINNQIDNPRRNPEAEFPLHAHMDIIEIMFIQNGRSIMNLESGRAPMRKYDLYVVMPGLSGEKIFHGMGFHKELAGKKYDRTYSGTPEEPYKGIVFKVPYSHKAVDRNDKSFINSEKPKPTLAISHDA